jgi:8-oxo-dGTP pyrophosphatase MutT (NUDIX family)
MNFLTSIATLQMNDAVAALLVLEDGRYLMQLRDDFPHVWYPGFWGLFGGGIEAGEDFTAALRRELREELELEIGGARLFTTFDFDMQPTGLRKYRRYYCEVAVTGAAWKRMVLHEGAEVRAFTGDEVLALSKLAPYDAFALFMHHYRHRLGDST